MFTGATGIIRHEAIRKIALPGSAILALLLGIGIYLLDRDWASTLFLAPVAGYQPDASIFFGSPGQVLPSFLHACVFSLLLILAPGRAGQARHIGPFAWAVVAAGPEVLQAAYLDRLFNRSPLQPEASMEINSVQTCLVNGHFDWNDLVASGLGCLAAFAIASVPEESQ